MKPQTIGLATIALIVNQTSVNAQELEPLKYFAGTWRCQQPAAPKEAADIFIWTVKKDLNDFWYLGNVEQIQSHNNGKPTNYREFLGYDIAAKKLVRSVVVGNGYSFNMTASNWQNNKLIWSGTLVNRTKGGSIPLGQEIVINNRDRFTANYFINDESSNWMPVVDETCERLK